MNDMLSKVNELALFANRGRVYNPQAAFERELSELGIGDFLSKLNNMFWAKVQKRAGSSNWLTRRQADFYLYARANGLKDAIKNYWNGDLMTVAGVKGRVSGAAGQFSKATSKYFNKVQDTVSDYTTFGVTSDDVSSVGRELKGKFVDNVRDTGAALSDFAQAKAAQIQDEASKIASKVGPFFIENKAYIGAFAGVVSLVLGAGLVLKWKSSKDAAMALEELILADDKLAAEYEKMDADGQKAFRTRFAAQMEQADSMAESLVESYFLPLAAQLDENLFETSLNEIFNPFSAVKKLFTKQEVPQTWWDKLKNQAEFVKSEVGVKVKELVDNVMQSNAANWLRSNPKSAVAVAGIIMVSLGSYFIYRRSAHEVAQDIEDKVMTSDMTSDSYNSASAEEKAAFRGEIERNINRLKVERQ
jgi:hypothetical protein